MTDARAESNVLIVGQFPPPINGFSYVTQELTKLLSTVRKVVCVDLRPHEHASGVSYHLDRMRFTLSGALQIIRNVRAVPQTPVYLACDGGLGVAYFWLLASVIRISGARAYLHHHNFSYIDKRFFPMALLLKILGRGITHIFLSEGMARKFAERYETPVKAIILSNSAFVPPSCSAPRVVGVSGEPLVMGLLSNLNEEKGLFVFLETLRLALAKGMNVRAILAGPVARERDRLALQLAQTEFKGRLDYRGAVHGEDKLAFYRDIDVFVFPTRYASEAQPTVVFEAMAYGIPCLSYDRGCIRDQIGLAAGAVASRDADFPTFALRHISAWLSDTALFDALRLGSRSRFLADRAEAIEVATNLLSLTPKVVAP